MDQPSVPVSSGKGLLSLWWLSLRVKQRFAVRVVSVKKINRYIKVDQHGTIGDREV